MMDGWHLGRVIVPIVYLAAAVLVLRLPAGLAGDAAGPSRWRSARTWGAAVLVVQAAVYLAWG
jgi:hypothetical protein